MLEYAWNRTWNHVTSYVTFIDAERYSECCQTSKMVWSRKERIAKNNYGLELLPEDFTICLTGKYMLNFWIHLNLYIADMLYNWHRPNHSQILTEKPLYSEHLYSGHFFEHRVKILSKIYHLIGDTLWLVEKIKTHACFYLTNFSTLPWSLLSNFSKLFFTHVITLASP